METKRRSLSEITNSSCMTRRIIPPTSIEDFLAYARAFAYTIYMNRLSIDERAQILAALVEGNSIRSVCRMLGREKRTVTRLLVDVGTAC